jgi:hypothetical protein
MLLGEQLRFKFREIGLIPISSALTKNVGSLS